MGPAIPAGHSRPAAAKGIGQACAAPSEARKSTVAPRNRSRPAPPKPLMLRSRDDRERPPPRRGCASHSGDCNESNERGRERAERETLNYLSFCRLPFFYCGTRLRNPLLSGDPIWVCKVPIIRSTPLGRRDRPGLFGSAAGREHFYFPPRVREVPLLQALFALSRLTKSPRHEIIGARCKTQEIPAEVAMR